MSNSIALCMICKNEENNISGLMDDVCPILEKVIVVDTGSSDKTLDILKAKQESYPNLQVVNHLWKDDFAEARNFSFSLAGNDVDWIFWVDGDDRVNSENLRRFKDHILDSDPNVDAWLLPYIYSKYPDGSAQTYLTRERFLRRAKNPKWVGAIHETVDISHLRQRNSDLLKIEHNPAGKIIEPRRNLKILQKEFEKNPNDPRTAYYYAKELFDHIDPKATEMLIHYLNLPSKYWDDEIGARFRLAKTYVAENKLREAIQTIEPVYHLDGTRRRSEYYFIFGEVECKLRNFKIAIDWYARCLYDPPGPPRVLNLEYWTWHPLKKIAECWKELGDFDQAFHYAERVQKILPNDYGTMAWLKAMSAYKLLPKDGHKLAVLECGSNVRWDSYKHSFEKLKVSDISGNVLDAEWKFSSRFPFADNSLDGIVLGRDASNYSFSEAELARVIKPKGFLWTAWALDIGHQPPCYLFNFLGMASYRGETFCNYVRVDETKPLLSYRDSGAMHAPYRYRIFNLAQSARKNGYRVMEERLLGDLIPDVHVGLSLDRKVGKVNVVEICEKLDSYNIGIEHADVINCSSKLLMEYLKEKFPDKKVLNIDDHFELTSDGWL